MGNGAGILEREGTSHFARVSLSALDSGSHPPGNGTLFPADDAELVFTGPSLVARASAGLVSSSEGSWSSDEDSTFSGPSLHLQDSTDWSKESWELLDDNELCDIGA